MGPQVSCSLGTLDCGEEGLGQLESGAALVAMPADFLTSVCSENSYPVLDLHTESSSAYGLQHIQLRMCPL